MTRFHNSEINLKSSVYNLAGENYIEQLSAYNSMRCHIRRVLLAKSVVDSRNNRYINEKKKRPKSQLSKGYSLDNLIDQLVYDTKHHPMDMLTMNFDEYCLYRKEKENNQAHPRDTSNINLSKLKMQTNDTEDNIQTICRNCPASRPKKNTRYKSVGKKHLKIYQKPLPRIVQRCNEKPIYVNCGNPFKTSTNPLQCDSCTSSSSMIHENRASSSLPCELRNYNRKRAEIEAKEDARYIAFAYDITREIIKCGLYTDKELNEIFKKHLKRHRTTLDLNKMLREIYRLKTFLNVSEESDDSDDDVECCNKDCIWKPQARPPTPPKVLDDNKVIGKLLSYQKLMENQCNKEPNSGKSVVLIDANPELLITERDVLTSLLEVGIDPKQAENICKSLHHKSMESVLENMAELKIRTPCEQLENVTEIQTKDIMCGEKACCDNSQTDTETETLSEKENKSSTTDDLTTQQDETIQTQSCPKTLFNDNYTEPMCSAFSQLHQEHLPLNVDEVIQTEEIQINIGSRVRTNKMGVQITEVFRAKEKFTNDNMDAPNIVERDILAWSRDKIAAIRANASNVFEKPVASTEYDYRIPITKSTHKLLSSNKRKKSPKPSRTGLRAKPETQKKKVKRERTPQRFTSAKPTETKSAKGTKSKKGTPRKKGRRTNPSTPVSSKMRIPSYCKIRSPSTSKPKIPSTSKTKIPYTSKLKIASTSKLKIPSTSNIKIPPTSKRKGTSKTRVKTNVPASNVSTCVSSTCGVNVTKINTQVDKDDTEVDCVCYVENGECKQNPDKKEAKLDTPEITQCE